MKSGHEAFDVPIHSPSMPVDHDPLTHFKGECERLRQRILELETERERDRRRLSELESERDNYRAETYAWARKEFERQGILDEMTLKRQIDQEEGIPLEGFLGELEKVAKGT